MKILYFDCFSGVSGDMVIGALLDAGVDAEVLEAELKKLPLDGEYDLAWKRVNKKGITSTKFDVLLPNDAHHSGGEQTLATKHGEVISEHEDGDYDHSDTNHGHAHAHTEGHHTHSDGEHHHAHAHTEGHHTHSDGEHHHAHVHTEGHHDHSDGEHNYAHVHTEGHHDHTHTHHRTYKHIVHLIQTSDLSDSVKTLAINIFTKIGEAEGRIHGVPLEDVHFHEVGAIDSIIDIVGAAILMDQLNIDKVISSPIPVGSGKINIDHGIYPVPAPATLDILKGIPLATSHIKGELTTPTGAAIIAVLANEFGTLPAMTVEAIGYGAGTKDFPNHPNVLRVVIGHQST